MRKLIQKSLAFGLQLKGIDEAISHFERCTRGGRVEGLGGCYVRRTGQIPMLINQWGLFVDGQARFNTHARTHARTCGPRARLTNGIFEAIKVSCKHMKANQLVSGVYYQGFNTDLEAEGARGGGL